MLHRHKIFVLLLLLIVSGCKSVRTVSAIEDKKAAITLSDLLQYSGTIEITQMATGCEGNFTPTLGKIVGGCSPMGDNDSPKKVPGSKTIIQFDAQVNRQSNGKVVQENQFNSRDEKQKQVDNNDSLNVAWVLLALMVCFFVFLFAQKIVHRVFSRYKFLF
jgi:hypothetical protein